MLICEKRQIDAGKGQYVISNHCNKISCSIVDNLENFDFFCFKVEENMDGIEGVTCSDLTFAPRCSSTQNFGEIARLAMNFSEKAQLASTPFNPMASNTLPSYPFRYEINIFIQRLFWY